ncbi:MAG TPA: hypothetical protein EYP56_17840 [Planctomycetaceae bacterium]|nr:hypothetical protein [Planctomycetaceae bacterium]HIQ20428.1 hypothetical protein [Planctomycetota bacterium]
MPKVLCIIGMVISVLLLLVFGLDLALKIPFGRANALMSISFVICSLVLGYLSWSTYREQL